MILLYALKSSIFVKKFSKTSHVSTRMILIGANTIESPSMMSAIIEKHIQEQCRKQENFFMRNSTTKPVNAMARVSNRTIRPSPALMALKARVAESLTVPIVDAI